MLKTGITTLNQPFKRYTVSCEIMSNTHEKINEQTKHRSNTWKMGKHSMKYTHTRELLCAVHQTEMEGESVQRPATEEAISVQMKYFLRTAQVQTRRSHLGVSESNGKLTVGCVTYSRIRADPLPAWAGRVLNGDVRVFWFQKALFPFSFFGVEGGYYQGHLANFIPRNASADRGDTCGPQGASAHHSEHPEVYQLMLKLHTWLVFCSIALNDSNTERKPVASKMFLFLKHRSVISLKESLVKYVYAQKEYLRTEMTQSSTERMNGQTVLY